MPRGRKPTHIYPPTPGGQKLHALRERAGLSLVDLEAEANYRIGTAHLQKIEVGAIRRPDPKTLDVILAALHAGYGDRRDVLEAFGYSLPMTLPTPAEVDEVRNLSVNELNDATYPILLIDFSHRLLAWNRFTPRLIGLRPEDPALQTFYGVTTFDLVFNPELGARLLVDNPREFWPTWLHIVKPELHAHHHEQWYASLIERLSGLPGFSEIWATLPEEQVRRFISLSIIPLRLRVPDAGILQFRLSSSDFLLDPRFQVIHFTPYGAATLRVCAQWAEEEGIL